MVQLLYIGQTLSLHHPSQQTGVSALGYFYGIVFPWNIRDIREYPRETKPSLVSFASPDYASWSASDGGYDLEMKMAAYKRELHLLNHALSLIQNLARTHQRPTPFGLSTQFSAFATPQTKFKLVLSEGS